MEGMDEILELFKSELTERLERVEEEVLKNAGRDIELIYREFHTIKGTSQMLGFENYSKAAHMIEDVVKPLWKANSSLPNDFIPRLLKAIDVFRRRIGDDLTEDDLKEIDSILKGESGEKREETKLEIVTSVDEELLERLVDLSERIFFEIYKRNPDSRILKDMEVLTSGLRELYWNVETVSLEDVLKGFERLVFEEATREGKKVRFELRAGSVRVKKDIASRLRDALVHIVKNSVVHGIEKPEDRKKVGKDEEGIVSIDGRMESRRVIVEVRDDGRGIDLKKIRKKLEEMGREVPERKEDLLKVIFEPFFSTKEKADLGGGRGVGLSSVKEFVESIGGKVEIETEEGRGTLFRLIVPGGRVWERVLVLRRGLSTFALRVDSVESVRLSERGMIAVLKNGKKYWFDYKLMEEELLVIENPFRRIKQVLFFVSFMGIPVPVLG